MRGENAESEIVVLACIGTSPRARGKQINVGLVVNPVGNIPACAGKTAFLTTGVQWGQEHPRVRGENLDDWRQLVGIEGTSPRARGKPLLKAIARKQGRNISACAGKTVM